jgi:hypothetical protein
MTEELVCHKCGWEPARVVTIRRQVGLLLLRQSERIRAPFCRECGRKTVVQYTTKTLWQGWWGVRSFVLNWFVLAGNLGAWLKLSRLPRRQSQPTESPILEEQGISEERWRSVFGEPHPEVD